MISASALEAVVSKKQEIIINSLASLKVAMALLVVAFAERKYVRLSLSFGKTRTNTQNRALHLYCRMLAEALNDAGLDQRQVLKPGIDIPWTPDAVKEQLWRPVQIAVIGKESTTDADSDEYSQVYDVLNRHLITRLCVSVPWPQQSKELE